MLACIGIVVTHGLALETLELVAFAALLVVLSVIDLETRRIPNVGVVAAAVIRVIYLLLLWLLGDPSARSSTLSSLVGAVVLGVALIIFTLVADKLSGTSNLGGGDIKLFAVVGLYFGVSTGWVVLLIACIVGAVWGVVVSIRSSGADRSFPFGPAIAIACIAAMIFM